MPSPNAPSLRQHAIELSARLHLLAQSALSSSSPRAADLPAANEALAASPPTPSTPSDVDEIMRPDIADVVVSRGLPNSFIYIRTIEAVTLDTYRRINMPSVAQLAPLATETLQGRCHTGTLWIAYDKYNDDTLLGFISVDPDVHSMRPTFADRVLVEQWCVDPDYAHIGIGRLLLQKAERWAQKHGFDGLVLTTFKEVPWCAPYFRKLGYKNIDLADMRRLGAHSLIKHHIRDINHHVYGMYERTVMIKERVVKEGSGDQTSKGSERRSD